MGGVVIPWHIRLCGWLGYHLPFGLGNRLIDIEDTWVFAHMEGMKWVEL